MPQKSFPRAGIKAADADLAAFSPTIVAPAQTIRVGAVGDTPGASITLAVHFLSAGQQPLSVQRVQFTAPGAPDAAGAPGATPPVPPTFVGTPAGDSCWALGGAGSVIIKVDDVAGGSWSFDAVWS